MSTALNLSTKDWLDLYRDSVQEHYSLWNYHWTGAAAVTLLASNVPSDVALVLPLITLGFIGFAILNGWLIAESQPQKIRTHQQLGPANVVGYPTPFGAFGVILAIIALDLLVVALIWLLGT